MSNPRELQTPMASSSIFLFWRQFRNELIKLFGKRRTYIGFGAFLLAQHAVILMFRFSHATRGLRRQLESGGYPVEQYLTALTIATQVVIPVAFLLLPLYAALVGGDLVAKETEEGTLRLVLARPISRVRLLALKWLAGAFFSLCLSLSLGLFGLVLAYPWFPSGGLFALNLAGGGGFSVFSPSEGLWRFAMAHVLLATKTITVMGLGFSFSCFNMKPAAATILALTLLFANTVLMNIPWFSEYRGWFLTHHLDIWEYVLQQRVPWSEMGESLSILVGYNVTFFAIGATAFQLRDIKS